MERGAVTPEWYAERAKALTETIGDERGDQWLHLTSSLHVPRPAALSTCIARSACAPNRSAAQIDVDEHRTPILPTTSIA